ncbi:hypothetical protein CCH79_00016281 [Gambusia affinis]|uniref:ADAMTS/ADAMTS-like Spacer 1 domain-containing protein n=1 Tax=Gambusia affinis TaxID=33528 RepID=A0A315VXI6_GAMAF|nr:hypothetical protein CCH79_00016281 [Gambusia affinis]
MDRWAAIKNQATGHYILNGKGDELKSRSFIDLGVEWHYILEGDVETLHTDGPLHDPVVVLYTKYGCRKKGDTKMVHRGYCEANKKPKPIRRMCNLQDCTQPQNVEQNIEPEQGLEHGDQLFRAHSYASSWITLLLLTGTESSWMMYLYINLPNPYNNRNPSTVGPVQAVGRCWFRSPASVLGERRVHPGRVASLSQ